MADQTDFKHITVNPAEPDDVVIHAGIPDSGSQAPMTSEEASKPAPPTSEPVSSKAVEAPAKAAPAKEASAYRATTLEDIQGFKMSRTQIAVIIVALALIVAFVVWYVVLS